jgi:hypothetical protein
VKRLYVETHLVDEAIRKYRSFGFDISAFIPNNGGNFPDLIEIDCIMVRKDLVKD